MQLKFYARPEHLQPWPDSHHYGQPRRYIGWQWVAATEPGKSASYRAKRDGDVVDDTLLSSAHVEEIAKACRDGSIIAADEATARRCAVAYAKHDYTEAGFKPAPESKAEKADKKPAPKEE